MRLYTYSGLAGEKEETGIWGRVQAGKDRVCAPTSVVHLRWLIEGRSY